MKILILKTIYKTLLTSLPILTYNSLTKIFFVPFNIEPYSTYINFKLDNTQVIELQKYINNYSDKLELHPIKLLPWDLPSYFLSINVYNCSSPVFVNNKKNVTRCEINTYVKDKKNNYGTLILDYCSNSLSLDPVNLFKNKQNINFTNNNNYLYFNILNNKINLTIDFNYINTKTNNFILSDRLIEFTDNIFYKNGICDKLFYDSSLVKSNIKSPLKHNNFYFSYKNINFKKIHSIFYFENKINFICGLWHNLYNKIYKFK
jgi:hypothetical protein